MQGRSALRENEHRIISVTPVVSGLLRPLLSLATSLVAVNFIATHIRALSSHEGLLLFIFAGPCAVVVGTRTWKWRSHKLHVTNQRVIAEGGVATRFTNAVELRDILGTGIEQSFVERLLRRGEVVLDTASGPFYSGLVSHPAALCRLIDSERATPPSGNVPLDTVFEANLQPDRVFETRPRRRIDGESEWSMRPDEYRD
jgi:membrane protein YdbS with pleckstrin-like domain